jgi:hypothetical protein
VILKRLLVVSTIIFFLSKFYFCGITCKANALFKFYLKNRYQRVIIYNVNVNHNTNFSWGKIEHGFSQGTEDRGSSLLMTYQFSK